MAEDRESSDRKHEKSKKRDRTAKTDPGGWTEQEKFQLAEAIDMYGTNDPKRLASRVPTKKPSQVVQMLRLLRFDNRKEIECQDMKELSFVQLENMDDLFLAGGTKPKDVLAKWMDYLEEFYEREPYQFDMYKMISSAFLIMSECLPPPMTTMDENDQKSGNADGQQSDEIDFRKVYYFLYRVINKFYVSKQHIDPATRKYLNELFFRVLNEIEYTSDNEKVAMYDLVSNWTSVNRMKNLKVYGKTYSTKTEQPEIKEEDVKEYKTNLWKAEFKVLERPMIPSVNPLRIKSNIPPPQ